MSLNKYMRLSQTRTRRLLILICLISWTTLLTLWMISGSDTNGVDGLYQLISTLHSPIFSASFGIPVVVILTLLILDPPTPAALHRLESAHALPDFILRTSFMMTVINILGCCLSLCCLFAFTGHVALDQENLFVGTLLLTLYWFGCFIVSTVLIIVSICHKKLTALFCVVVFLLIDNTLFHTLGINLFWHRGLSNNTPTYDYRLLINLALYVFYIILIRTNLTFILNQKLAR